MGKKILVIDDDRIMMRLLESRLTEKGHNVFSAFDGAEGLTMLTKMTPDLIILDVEMPEMNGYTFMTELHKLGSSFKSIPVIVLTSHEDKQPIFQLRGVKDYQVKPLDFNKLYSKIENLIINQRTVMNERIFIFEQNETYIKLMTHFLEKAMIGNITFCRSVDEGLELLKNENPSIVVINASIGLPKTKGYQLCSKLKEMHPTVKTILLVGSSEEINENELKLAAVDGFAEKTSDYAFLISSITQVVRPKDN